MANTGSSTNTVTRLNTIALAITSPMSAPILKRIIISAAKPIKVVSPLAMMEEVDFTTACFMASCTSSPLCLNSAKRWSRKME